MDRTVKTKIPLIANVDTANIKHRGTIDKIVKDFDGFWIENFNLNEEKDKFLLEKIKKLRKPFIFHVKGFYDILHDADCFAFTRNDAKFIRRLRPPFDDEPSNIEYGGKFDYLEGGRIKTAVLKCQQIVQANPNVRAVVCVSFTGKMAIELSKLQLNCKIFAIVFNEKIAKNLQLWHEVVPILHNAKKRRGSSFKEPKRTRKIRFILPPPPMEKVKEQSKRYIKYALKFAVDQGYLSPEDFIVSCINEDIVEVTHIDENY